ncbi:MAG: hypothetical protein AABY22_30625, partial [Nanoarchaeota archaeon]
SEKKNIIEKLNNQFEIKNLHYLFLKFGKDKIRVYSGSLSKTDLNILDKNARIESIGLYFARIQQDGIRLTIDGTQLVKNQITKNILEINDKESIEWLKGQDLDIKKEKSFKIIKNENEFLGCGKSTGEKITNFIPKERRIK